MKKIFLFSLLLGGIATANSQQLQTSSHYDMQGVLANPAMAGMMKNNIIGITYRSQWDGISGSPKTATVFGSFDMPAQNIGVGGYVYNDKTGPTSRTGVVLSLAKHIPLNNDAKFSIGIEAMGLQYSIDVNKLQQTLGNDPVLAGGSSKFKFDAGFGIAYASKTLQIGASVSQLVQSKLDFYTGTTTSVTEQGRLYRHYYLHGSYKWVVDDANVIVPTFLMIYLPNAPTDLQFGVRLEHKELLWWGIANRINQSFILSAGIHLAKKFTIGYAFDIYRKPLSVFDNGANSHEILLSFNLAK